MALKILGTDNKTRPEPTIDHGDTDGLSDNDHPQYAQLAGVNTFSAQNTFSLHPIAPWYNFSLNDQVYGSHFDDNDSSYPEGWVEADAALGTDTNERRGFWYLKGNSIDTTWKYRNQPGYNVESDTADGDFLSFEWRQILYRDTRNPSDETYYFGIYADNAGSINENIFIRVALNWNSAGTAWRARCERKDGTTQTNGSWFTLSQSPQLQPIFIRNTIRHFASNTSERARSYIGATPVATSHLQLMNDGMNITWGNIWRQVHMTRGVGGIENYLFVGGVDMANLP